MNSIQKVTLTTSTYPGRRMVEDCIVSKKIVNLANLGLENYVKESRERLLIAARSLEIDLIEPIREFTIAAKKQKKEEITFYWEKIS